MPVNMIHAVQNAGPDTGRLKISVTSSIGLIPVTDATVKISYKGMPDSIIETLNTDISGNLIAFSSAGVQYGARGRTALFRIQHRSECTRI